MYFQNLILFFFPKICYSQSCLRCTIKFICDISIKLDKCCTMTRGEDEILVAVCFLHFSFSSGRFPLLLLLLLITFPL